MALFSKRHYRTLLVEKSLKVSVPGRLRRRLWHLLREFDHRIVKRPDPLPLG